MKDICDLERARELAARDEWQNGAEIETLDRVLDRARFWQNALAELSAASGNPAKATNIAAASPYTDRQQKLVDTAGWLLREGLIDEATCRRFQKMVYAPSEPIARQDREDRERLASLIARRDALIARATDRRKALDAYNLLGETPISEGKLAAFERRLRELHLWPGGLKALLGGAQNKAIDPRKGDK